MALKNKKILCISVMENWGGGEEFLLKLFNNVTGYDYIVASPIGEPFQKFSSAGIKVTKINSLKKIYRKNNKWSLLDKIITLINIKISTFQLIAVILKNKVDFIFCNGNFAGLFGLPAALITFKKLLIVQHLIYPEKSFEGKTLRQLNRFSHKMICISESVSENVKRILGYNYKNNIVTIYHGINIPAHNEINAELTEPDNKRINIGIIGNILRLKGIDLVVDALKEIIINNPNVHLQIYGSTRHDEEDSVKYEEELKSLINSYGISGNVHFQGFENSKQAIYSNLDIVVNYSTIAESFSFAVLEAIAYKKIVIASNIGGPAEIISNGINGFLLPPLHKEKLKDKIEYCIKNINSKEFDLIRENGRKTVEAKFSMAKFVKSYEELFDSI
jgi:glycosyltransferase involved in cell wall biosynthesis